MIGFFAVHLCQKAQLYAANNFYHQSYCYYQLTTREYDRGMRWKHGVSGQSDNQFYAFKMNGLYKFG
jgi:hypothetical protein